MYIGSFYIIKVAILKWINTFHYHIILHSIEQIILMNKRCFLPKVPETYRKEFISSERSYSTDRIRVYAFKGF